VENLMNSLLKIDKQAREAVRSALEQKEAALQDAQQQKEKVREEYKKRAMDEIEATKAEKAVANRQRLQQLTDEYQEKKKKLMTVFEQNREKWEEQIINNCLGR